MVTKRAKRPRQATGQPTGQPTGQDDGHDDGHVEDDEEFLVGNIFDEMQEDSYVIVKRRDERTKEMVYLYRLDRDECTDEELQRLSGGGHYVCREKNPNAQGMFVWGRQRTIKIAGAPREPQEPESVKRHTATGVVADTNGATPGTQPTTQSILDGGLLQLFSAQAEVSKQGSEVMQLLMTKLMTEKKTEWGPVIVALVPLVQSWISRPQEERPDPLAMVTAIATMVKENVTPASDLKSQLEVMNDFMDLKTSMQPDPPDALASLAGVVPKIIEIMANDQKAGRPSTPQSVNAALTGGTPTPTPATGAPVIQQMLTKFAPRLVGWASAGKDPDVQASVLLELVPEKYHGHIRELLGHEDAAEQVFTMVPQLRQFEQWSNDFFGSLTDYFYPEDETGEPEVGDVEVREVGEDQAALDKQMKEHDEGNVNVEVGEVPDGN
jgi:hypothetical protein